MKILCKYLKVGCVAWTTICLFWTINNSDALSYKNYYRMLRKPVSFREKDVLRVIDGDTIDPDEFPYVVIIGPANLRASQKLHRLCTGTLITEAWVITAAHCMVDEQQNPMKSELRVYYGNLTVDPRNTTEYVRVIKKIPHPNYCQMKFVNDIGLLLIKRTLIKTFANLSAVDYLSLPGFSVTYAGGGLTVADDLIDKRPREALTSMMRDQFRPLQKGEAVVVACQRQDPPLLICLRTKCSRKSQIINPGDSGGPLFYRGKIVGVACCKGVDLSEKYMFFYTSISPFIEWIYDTMQNEIPENEMSTSSSEETRKSEKHLVLQRTKSPKYLVRDLRKAQKYKSAGKHPKKKSFEYFEYDHS